jgi:hypothetical protein
MGKDNRNCILQKLAKIWQEAEPVAKKSGEVGGIASNRKNRQTMGKCSSSHPELWVSGGGKIVFGSK